MNDKCEICGFASDLTKVYSCACDKKSPSATLCKKCREKYFDYPFIPSVHYIENWSYAENLVYAYNIRFHKNEVLQKKEATTMQVTYNGFTGELVKLERSYAGKFELPVGLAGAANVKWLYGLSIYDSEKQVTHSFSCVKLEDVKFMDGAVSFGG